VKYLVRLSATLPASATMIVEADSEDEAREYAEGNGEKANWNGSDYNTPQGCDIDVFEISEVLQ
jgi:hypothetical protein